MKNNSKALVGLVIILSISNIVFIVFSFLFAIRMQNPVKSNSDDLIEKLSNFVLLDRQQEPTIGTIENIETLKNNNPELFKNAQNGDRLIVYTDKVIIFRESDSLIINQTLLSNEELEL